MKQLLISCAAVAILIVGTVQAALAAEPMNVVLILADDLGWKDLACYGSDLHETPHLDALAQRGMRFTQNYSACTVCSPTRAALMTGKYPARLHITDWIPGAMPENPKLLVPDWTRHLPLQEVTLAERFRDAGYQTASIGKWHLGTEEFYPEKQGFDINIAGTDKPQPPRYHAPWNIPTLREGKAGEYLTERLADEAVNWLEKTDRSRPFFLYLPHFAVHTPIQAREKITKRYEGRLSESKLHKNAAYAAMLESLDAAVGKVVQKIEDMHLADRTIILFTSDNGGRVPTTSNSPLRYGKASAYEGGVRVPLIVSWPGLTKPGSICDQPTITMDLFHTLVSTLPSTTNRSDAVTGDGVNLAGALQGQPLPERDLFWHYPHHQHYQQGGTMPYAAIRSGDWKLIEFYNDQHVELYNVREDISEADDLAARQPERTNSLRNRLHAWQKSVDAQMAYPNPNYDPSKPEHTPK